jgi:hypothetical protein
MDGERVGLAGEPAMSKAGEDRMKLAMMCLVAQNVSENRFSTRTLSGPAL